MKKSMQDVADAIADDVRTMLQAIMESSNVADNKSSVKQLRDNLRKDDVVVKASLANGSSSPVIEILYDSVLEWDRKPQTGKYPSVSDIKEWASSKGLSTDNATLNLVRRAIWWNGHAGRPLIDLLDKEIDLMIDKKWGDMIFEALTADLAEIFE